MVSKKRHLVWLIAVLAVFGLLAAACSSDDDSSSGSDGSATDSGDASGGFDYGSLAGTLNGAGSSFQQAFDEVAIAGLAEAAPDLTVNYDPVGSGDGKTKLANETVDFAGSDSLVKDEDLGSFQGGDILYFPTVSAPITVSYNLSGVDNLQLSPDTLAGIMQRDITSWDDAAIAEDNPDADLPSEDISVVHRSDDSGTTNNFTSYLDAAAPDTWTLGSGDSVPWPNDTLAGAKNGGVAQLISETDGSIGYVDFSDATAAQLSMAAILNQEGEYVAPSIDATTAAVDNAEISPELTYLPVNEPGAGVYPIVSPTYIIVYSTQTDETVANNLEGWLTYLLTDAQALAADALYAPLPESLQQQALDQISQITVG